MVTSKHKLNKDLMLWFFIPSCCLEKKEIMDIRDVILLDHDEGVIDDEELILFLHGIRFKRNPFFSIQELPSIST